MENNSNTSDRELHISRLLDAPVALVWEAWCKPEHICNWWGPTGFTCTITKMDLEPGGEWILVMHGPDGTDYFNSSVFEDVVPMEKIVYRHVSNPGFVSTITFTAQGDKTLLDWHMVFDSVEEFIQTVKIYKADEGLKQNFEKLMVYLEDMKG
jgi:uncharacterized protein YndB with AHSA1/START domain